MASRKMNTRTDAVFGSVRMDHDGLRALLDVRGKYNKSWRDGEEDLRRIGNVHSNRRLAENRRDLDTFVDIAGGEC